MITPNRFASGWESGCGPADPALSAIATTAYAGNGYGTVVKGTIGVGNPGTTPDTPDPVQIRAFKGSDGNLYFLDNDNRAYMVTGGALAPAPPNYAPTK